MLLKKKLLPIFSLKGSIIFGFLVLLLVTFVTMFGYRYIENNKANVTIGESFINFTHTKIISRLEKEFSNIQFLSGLGDQLYNTEKEVDLNNIVLIGGMREILRNTPLIKSVKTGTKSGKFLQVIRIEENDIYRLNSQKKLPSGSFIALRYIDHTSKDKEVWVYESQEKKILDKEFIVDSTYDHRKQSWYKDCDDTQTINWSDIYSFKDSREPVIRVSHAVFNSNLNVFMGVFSVDIETSSLSNVLNEEKVGDNSSVFIVSSKGEIIAHSDNSKIANIKNGKVDVPLLYNSKDIKMKKAIEFFDKTGDSTFSFEYDGKIYVACLSFFPKINSYSSKGKIISMDTFDDWRV